MEPDLRYRAQDHRSIGPHQNTRMNQMLRAEGIAVMEPNLDRFSVGGGVHRMTILPQRGPV
jgi:hypothetical protein